MRAPIRYALRSFARCYCTTLRTRFLGFRSNSPLELEWKKSPRSSLIRFAFVNDRVVKPAVLLVIRAMHAERAFG